MRPGVPEHSTQQTTQADQSKMIILKLNTDNYLGTDILTQALFTTKIFCLAH